MGILEMDFERILGVPFFHSSSHSIMLCYRLCESGPQRLFKLISFTFSKTRPIRQTDRHDRSYLQKTKKWQWPSPYNCRRPLPLTHVKATYDHLVMSPKLVRSYLQKIGNFKVIKKSSNAHCYALSFYRSQNFLCRSKFFEPADCI